MAPVSYQRMHDLYIGLGGDALTETAFNRLLANLDVLRAVVSGELTRQQLTPLLKTVRFCSLLRHYNVRGFHGLVEAHWEERGEWFIGVDGRFVRLSDHYGELTKDRLRQHWHDVERWLIRTTRPCDCETDV